MIKYLCISFQKQPICVIMAVEMDIETIQSCEMLSSPPPRLSPVPSLTDLLESGVIGPLELSDIEVSNLSQKQLGHSLRQSLLKQGSTLSRKLALSRQSSGTSVKSAMSRQSSGLQAILYRKLSKKVTWTGVFTGAVDVVQNMDSVNEEDLSSDVCPKQSPAFELQPEPQSETQSESQENNQLEFHSEPQSEPQKFQPKPYQGMASSVPDANDGLGVPEEAINNENIENVNEQTDNETVDDTNASEDGINEEAMDIAEPEAQADENASAMIPPVGPANIEIVISFDTTGSMSTCIDAVKENVRDTITRLFMDIPSLKIALLAHGDYCDENVFYLKQSVDFTNNLETLCQFVTDVEGTGGGDFAECYELILQDVREKFSWSAGTQKSLIMIGDAIPHEVNDPENRTGLDWRQEALKLYTDLVGYFK